jgi:hypothetical protein
MTTMKANLQPTPLPLPCSANEEEEDWGQFEDDVSISSMSTISTTCEAADDIRMFETTFDQTQTVVVYLIDQHQRDKVSCNTLQPHHGGGVKDLVMDIIDTASDIIDYHEKEIKRVTVPTAILLMSNLKEYNHEDIDQNDNIVPLEKKKSRNHASNHDFHLLPIVQASDVGKILPPDFLVQPREGFLLSYSPAKKRARVTPVSSPTRDTLHDDPELIPSLDVSVPNLLGHQDD